MVICSDHKFTFKLLILPNYLYQKALMKTDDDLKNFL